MESVMGWEAMDAEPLFTTKPVAESEIRISNATSEAAEIPSIGRSTGIDSWEIQLLLAFPAQWAVGSGPHQWETLVGTMVGSESG